MEFEKQQVWQRLMGSGEYETHYTQADESEREVFRQWVKSLLWEQSVLIEFVKATGETRTMNCTLNSLFGAVYPEDQRYFENTDAVAKVNRKQNQHVCSVWDIDKGAWRSFRWDRLRRIEFKIG